MIASAARMNRKIFALLYFNMAYGWAPCTLHGHAPLPSRRGAAGHVEVEESVGIGEYIAEREDRSFGGNERESGSWIADGGRQGGASAGESDERENGGESEDLGVHTRGGGNHSTVSLLGMDRRNSATRLQ